MDLHTRTGGDDGGDGLVVFLHGFPFDGSLWDAQLRALPRGWRGIAPDLRGFGRTPLQHPQDTLPTGAETGSAVAKAHEPVLTMAAMAGDVARLIEREGGGPAVVCGLSMGGYVAFELWRRRPDLVRALVLSTTRAEADSPEGREGRVRTAETARAGGAEPIARAMVPKLVAPATLEGRPHAVEHARRMILGTATEALVAALAGMAERDDSVGDLPGVRVPTLVMAGAEDAIIPRAASERMATAIPDARLVVIGGAGHLPNLEQTDRFNEVLAEFLSSLPLPPTRRTSPLPP